MLADSGYQGIKNIIPEAVIPHKKPKNKDLDEQQKAFNKNLSSKRVIIEHVNRKLKIFKSIGLTYRSRIKEIVKIINLIPTFRIKILIIIIFIYKRTTVGNIENKIIY